MRYNYSSIIKSLGLAAIAFATIGTATPVQADESQADTATRVMRQVFRQASKLNAPRASRSGIDPQDFDKSVKPSDDFYNYAIGGWRKANPIPEDQPCWGSFMILGDNNAKILHEMLERAAKSPKDAIEKKLGDFYASGMDQEAIDREGITPIRQELSLIAAIENPEELTQAIAFLHSQDINPYFNLYIGQDDKDSSRIIAHICQGGLGLPERDYYTREDEKSKLLRAKYRQHMVSMFRLIGDTPQAAEKEADAVMALETKLAKASLPAADMRDPERVYHLMNLENMTAIAPDYPWAEYFEKLGAENIKEANVMVPEFITTVNNEIFRDTPLIDHLSYLRWHLIRSAAPYLSQEMEDEHFQFYRKELRGVATQSPRWKRVTNTIGSKNMLGFALGQMYVKEHFSPKAKAKVEEIVTNITKVLEKEIPEQEWMSPDTQKEALSKLHTFFAKIGYPNENRDYTKLSISRTGYYDNVRRARIFETARQIATIGKPVDRNEWHMTPQTINAYYNPACNEIVFPAGILQPPFFNSEVDDAANYGAIGAVIGHEISHGYDDQGSQYDAQGNLRNWWQEEDLKAFQKLAKGVEDQFSEYTVGDTHINGKLVLGEALADLNGLSLSWKAYQLSRQGKKDEIIDGLTPAQRFFLAYAKVWASNFKPEYEQLQVSTDPHPHAMWRVNGTLSNMEPFFKAFDVKEGDPMRRPADKINKIW
ncbi:M13 family metallopeptidase [bacterium]|nr:M13 family metallopeptidase [bacterium]